METNYIIFFVAALIPLVIREIWYNEKVLGAALAKANNLPGDTPQKMNRALELGLVYVLGLIIAVTLSGMVIHQSAIFSLLVGVEGFNDVNSEVNQYFTNFMETYGDRHRSFGHGVLHGVFAGLLFVVPILTTFGFTEKRKFKSTLIHGGFWLICLGLMGGLICAFA